MWKNRKNSRSAAGAPRPFELTLGTAVTGKRVEQVTLRGHEAHQHVHLMGVTGSGKTRSIISRFLQTHNQGIGCAFIDPHGDACDHILGSLADQGYFRDERAWSRLWYVPFGDARGRFAPLNVLAQDYDSHHRARLVWEAMGRAWPDLAGAGAPMMQQIVLAGAYALAENQLPLTALERLYTDDAYRATLLQRIQDPQILGFFARFEAMGRRSNQTIESALRRLFLLTFNPSLRYSLGQRELLLDFRRLLDTPGIGLLFDLRGLDPENKRLLGAFLMLGFEQGALSRSATLEAQRAHFHLLADEFTSYCARSGAALETMLAQARKFHLTLLLAHQTWSQVDAHTLQGALQNAVFLAHRLGPEDAQWASSRLVVVERDRLKYSPRGTPSWMSAAEQRQELAQELMTLPAREALLRLGQQTLHLHSLGAPDPQCSQAELGVIKEEYARRLLRSTGEIEAQWRAVERGSAMQDRIHTQAQPSGAGLGGAATAVASDQKSAPLKATSGRQLQRKSQRPVEN